MIYDHIQLLKFFFNIFIYLDVHNTMVVMKRSVLIGIIIAGIIITIFSAGLFFDHTPKKDIAGNDFDAFYIPEKEQMCCENCLSYGEYDGSKDCLEIIKEHGGIRHCYMIMEDHPHTFSMCKELMAR